MKNYKAYLLAIVCIYITNVTAQVGIGTTNPQGALDVVSSNLGFVAPRVTSIRDVTDGNGNSAVDGTIVFDTSRQQTCFKIAGSWICIEKKSDGTGSINIVSEIYSQISNYIKASNTDSNDSYGLGLSISNDGSRLAVGAPAEDSNATGINGNQSDNSAGSSGAVYVYSRSGSIWVQEAYIKASNTETNDYFGESVSLNSDGSRLAIGAGRESSGNGNQSDNSANFAGAVYIFSRSGTTWTQEAYLKASTIESGDSFGKSVAISNDATRLVVGASSEDSNATGINGNQNDNNALGSGAIYVFSRSGTTWMQEAYIKASNTDALDELGFKVSISADGSRIIAGAKGEDSNAIGINGSQSDNSASSSGAIYVFSRSGTTWIQEAYVKASNTDAFDQFGTSISMSSDGSRITVGAPGEESNATGVNGNQSDNTASSSGAVYVFSRSGTIWTQEAYIKASNTELGDLFGISTKINQDGATIIIGARGEDSNTIGVGGNQSDNSFGSSGAIYVFKRTGVSWFQEAYIKSSNTGVSDSFGSQVAINGDGLLLVGVAISEDSNATGINGDQSNNSASGAGAVYIID